MNDDSARTVRVVLDQYEALVSAELDEVDERMATIARHSGIEVFALSEAMLSRAVELSTINLDLKPFDQADDVVFCELDGDLQPWD